MAKHWLFNTHSGRGEWQIVDFACVSPLFCNDYYYDHTLHSQMLLSNAHMKLRAFRR